MSTEISQLPDLPLVEILSLINASERIKLRLVCKRWNFLVERVKQTSLCLYGTRFPGGEYLTYERLLNYRDTIQVGSSDAAPNVARVLFKSVDYLYLYAIENSTFLPDLNHLIGLKELVICRLNYFEPLTLRLPNLSMFCLKFSEFKQLELDTERLTTFVFWGDFDSFETISVHFRHPETLKVLEYESYVIKNALKEFANLEHLTCVQESNSPIDLKQLPKLKMLDMVPRNRHGARPIVDIGSMVQGIPQRPDLKIYSLGFENRLLTISAFWYKFRISMYMPYYDSLVNRIPFPVEAFDRYEDIADKFRKHSNHKPEIPESFFRKWPYISSISTIIESDSSDLIDFLRKSRCPALTVTILSEFDRAAFDQISSLTSLTSLEIRKNFPICPNLCELNFDFLPNMMSLRSLKIQISFVKWPLKPVLAAVKNCKFFSELIIQNVKYDPYKYFVHVLFRPYTKEAYNCKIAGKELPERSAEELVQYLRENKEINQLCN